MALSDIKAAVAAAARQAGRDPASVRLIAVSKVQPLDRVEAVLDDGHRLFGENRVQEAAGKWPDFKARYDGVEAAPDRPLADQQGAAGDGALSTRSTRWTGPSWPRRWPGWRRRPGPAPT